MCQHLNESQYHFFSSNLKLVPSAYSYTINELFSIFCQKDAEQIKLCNLSSAFSVINSNFITKSWSTKYVNFSDHSLAKIENWLCGGKNARLSTFDTSQWGEKSFPGKSGWILTFSCCHEMQIFAEFNPSAVSLGRWPGKYSLIHRLVCSGGITLSEIQNILDILWVNPLKKFYFVANWILF